MDIDYLLIILPSIIFLGVFGLILIIWHGHFRSKKEKVHLNAEDSVTEPSSQTKPYSQQSDFWQGAARMKQPECINIHEDCELSGNTAKNSSAKSISTTSRLEPTLTQSNIKEETTNSTNCATQHDIDNYIILQLMAPQQRPYRGYELIQTLTSAGFHYGRMNIFHFYADPLSKKELLFSLASAIEPGTFDLDNTGEIVCPGLCLFMSIHKVKSALTALDLMWETAQILAQDLGGILCDRQLQPIEDLTRYHTQLHTYA